MASTLLLGDQARHPLGDTFVGRIDLADLFSRLRNAAAAVRGTLLTLDESD